MIVFCNAFFTATSTQDIVPVRATTATTTTTTMTRILATPFSHLLTLGLMDFHLKIETEIHRQIVIRRFNYALIDYLLSGIVYWLQ